MSDVLVMTLGLLVGVVGCLAKPCRPEQWTHVKAARQAPAPQLVAAGEPVVETEPASEPGFADGLATAAA